MILLTALIAYLIGSIPNGYIIGKVFFKTDIRTLGSGNIGSTNALRNFGRKAGIGTLVLDGLKGLLAVMIGQKLASESGLAVGLLFVVLGHMYSIFLKFKGGKGVATSFGAFIYIDIRFTLILLAIFLIVVFLSRMVSLGSITGAISAIIVGYFFFGISKLYYAIVIIGLLIVYRHKSNIQRIKNHEESKIF